VTAKFNHLCPLCNGPVHITYLTAKGLSIPIRDNGWAVMVTHKMDVQSESFECQKCQVDIPPMYVICEMSLKDAVAFMKKWQANKFSIHNRAPFTPDDFKEKPPDPEPSDDPAEEPATEQSEVS
jgi:hypothetical protein